MSVWYAIPSKRPGAEVKQILAKWQERGYNTIIQRDPGDAIWYPIIETDSARSLWYGSEFDNEAVRTVNIIRPYSGYAEAVNHLVRIILDHDPAAEWIVTGGDDISPDPNHTAQEIAAQCTEHFGGTVGVMQPTGDRWQVNGPGTVPGIDLVAGSPWMGREFCRRMYGGRGPLCEEYFHCGEDEELQAVATKMGVFRQRPDLTHFHHHWGRPREGEKIGRADRMPEFLKRANSREEWQKFKKTFAGRKAAGFPGHEPIL